MPSTSSVRNRDMGSPIITPMPVQTDTEYRPVSRLAIVGLILSCFSFLLFGGLGLVLLLFTIPGGVLSYIALRTIRKSEGTLVGEPIALLGIIVAVACGLGWSTSQLMNRYITDLEGKRALDQWLGYFQRGEVGSAFLMTRPPKFRNIPFSPEDHRRLRLQFPSDQRVSEFDGFLADPNYSQFIRYRDQVKLTYLSQIESSYQNGSYVHRWKYHMTTPVSEGDVVFVARSEDVTTERGTRRLWSVYFEAGSSRTQKTQYGSELAAAEKESQELAKKNFILPIANEEFDTVRQILDPDKTKQGNYEQLLGYLRPKNATGQVLMELQLPLQLDSEKKEGNGWALNYRCTAVLNQDREVQFSIRMTKDEAKKSWTISQCKFLGERRVLAPIQSMQAGAPPDQ